MLTLVLISILWLTMYICTRKSYNVAPLFGAMLYLSALIAKMTENVKSLFTYSFIF